MKSCLLLLVGIAALCNALFAQADSVISFSFRNDVTVTIDYPLNFSHKKNTQLLFFALPNGNTTAQTMGKKMQQGDDWHFDIQHIAAQTKFVRNKLPDENIVVVYLENKLKAWPAWKRGHADYKELIPKLLDTVPRILSLKKYSIHLNSHSGGGSFIFGYLDAVREIPNNIQRISFIDSDYGYDSSYATKMLRWVKANPKHLLTVFAYNDSIALYNGKPIVSAKGGTWYRSKLMMKDFAVQFDIVVQDSVQVFSAFHKQVNVLLIDNPDRKILHTQQVELNGFIHSVLIGTKKESEGYRYFGQRSYVDYIQ